MNKFRLLSVMVLVLSISNALAQNPTVTSISPGRNALNVPKDVNIIVTFDQELRAATLNEHTVIVRGDITGKHMGAISYQPSTSTMTFNPNYDFLAGEIVTVQLSQQIYTEENEWLDQSQYWTFTIVTTAGTGIFSWDASYECGSDDPDWVVADMDGDYDADLLGKDRSGAIYVQENNGTGSFSPWDVFYAYTDNTTRNVAAGDINRDTLIDLISIFSGGGSYDRYLVIMTNNGDGTFDVGYSDFYIPNNPYYVKLIDLMGDGIMDAIFDIWGSGGGTGGFGYAMQSHSAGFSQPAIIETELTGGLLATPGPIGDINNDGWVDFVLTSNGKMIVYSHYTFPFSYVDSLTFDTTRLPFPGSSPELADFNGDGWLDFCLQDGSAEPDFSFSIILNNQDGTFSLGGRYIIPGRCEWPYCSEAFYTLGDVNADGSIDIVATRYNSQIENDTGFVLLNNGDGTFGELLSFWPTGAWPIPTDLVDIDNDGDLDLVAEDDSGTGYYLRILINGGGISPTVCGDANGDNEPNVGDAVYLISYVFKGGPAPDPACAGDANGDDDCNVGDAVYLISYVFKSGPPPVEDCCN